MSLSVAIQIFSPLVSKLRENNKVVIGVGVKHSTSDLLVANCDEFIFYDDLVRRQKPKPRPPAKNARKSGAKEKSDTSQEQERKDKAIELVMETIDQLIEGRGDQDFLWGSMVKQAIKRRRPEFSERYHGFRSFNALLEEAEDRGLLQLKADERSGGYIVQVADSGSS